MLDPANCSLSHPHFFSFFSLPSSPPLLFSLLAVIAPSQMKFCFVKTTNRIQKRKKLAKNIVSAFSFLRSAEWRIYLEKKVPRINLMDNKSSQQRQVDGFGFCQTQMFRGSALIPQLSAHGAIYPVLEEWTLKKNKNNLSSNSFFF